VSASSKKIYLRKQCEEKSSALQTNSTHKRLHLGSHITEPNSAGKVYYCSPPGEIYKRISKKSPCVLQGAQGAKGGEFFCSSVFLEAGLAKWGRLKRIQTLEWLGKENKQKKALWSNCVWSTVHG